MGNELKIIRGGTFNDARGTIRFINDFKFKDVKRFYIIEHPSTSIVRAWQGHQCEKKYFYPIKGSFVVVWVKIDNFENPSKELKADYHFLNADSPEIITIPKGYVNGLKATSSNSKILVMSNTEFNKSKSDKIRYPPEWRFDCEQEI